MSLGVYCFVDKKDHKIVYVGKDSHIDENRRRRDHMKPSTYKEQVINRVLQNNPDRYTYQQNSKLLNSLTITLFAKMYKVIYIVRSFFSNGINCFKIVNSEFH